MSSQRIEKITGASRGIRAVPALGPRPPVRERGEDLDAAEEEAARRPAPRGPGGNAGPEGDPGPGHVDVRV